jgi:hypothetical protein
MRLGAIGTLDCSIRSPLFEIGANGGEGIRFWRWRIRINDRFTGGSGCIWHFVCIKILVNVYDTLRVHGVHIL